MKKKEMKKLLRESMGYRYIYSEKYQDKFYVYKEIQELLPHLSEDEIYNAIDGVNKSMKSPITGKKFVEAFIEKLES